MDQVTENDDLSYDGTVGRYLTYMLARVQAKLNAQGARILNNSAGLSLIQWRIIRLVQEREGATSTELSARSSIDKGLFSRKLKTLVQDGLVRAEVDQADNRVQHLHLTEKGREIYEHVLPIMTRRQDKLRDGLGQENAEALFELLLQVEQVLDNWEEP